MSINKGLNNELAMKLSSQLRTPKEKKRLNLKNNHLKGRLSVDYKKVFENTQRKALIKKAINISDPLNAGNIVSPSNGKIKKINLEKLQFTHLIDDSDSNLGSTNNAVLYENFKNNSNRYSKINRFASTSRRNKLTTKDTERSKDLLVRNLSTGNGTSRYIISSQPKLREGSHNMISQRRFSERLNASESNRNCKIDSVEFDMKDSCKYSYGRDLNYTCIQGPGKRKFISEKHRQYLEKAKIDFSNEENLTKTIAKLKTIEERKKECEKILNLDQDQKNMEDFIKSIKAMQSLRLEVEITHNMLRNISMEGDETEQIKETISSPHTRDYSNSLLGSKLIMESRLGSREKFDSERLERDNKEYAKLARNLIRMICNPKLLYRNLDTFSPRGLGLPPFSDTPQINMGMTWKERILLSANIETLWKCMLLSQDKLLANQDIMIKKIVAEKEKEFQADKDIYLKLIHKMKNEISELGQKLDTVQNNFEEKSKLQAKELNRVTKISNDREFDLRAILENNKIFLLKREFEKMGENIDLVSSETNLQLKTVENLIKYMTDNIRIPDSKNSKVKLMLRKRRKRGFNSAMVSNETLQDEIIFSKTQSKMGFKKVPTFVTTDDAKFKIQVTNEDGMVKTQNAFSSQNTEETTSMEKLLIYIEEKINDLYRSSGKIVEKKEIDRSDLLEIIDSIPFSILNMITPIEKPKKEKEVQTDLGGSQELPIHKITEKHVRKRGKSIIMRPGNALARAINKALIQKKEKHSAMTESNAFKLIETLLDDKCQLDLDNIVTSKKIKPLANFVLDQMSMKFGLKTLAVKNLIAMKMGLDKKQKALREKRHNIEDVNISYAQFCLQIMGIDDKNFIEIPEDQIDCVVKARAIFQEATEAYKKAMDIKPKKIQETMKVGVDLNTGGECSIFEVIEITTICIGKDKELLNSFIPKIQPIMNEGENDPNQFLLNFSLLKICHRIAKMGKDIKYLYQALDKDGGGTLDLQEIFHGLNENFNICFSKEEAIEVTQYLDSDQSGDVDFEEFQLKINYNNYNKLYHQFVITKQRYLELAIEEWKLYKESTKRRLMKKFAEFDDNGDGVLTFDEFESLVNNLDPNLSRNEISELFNETLELVTDEEDPDKMTPESFCITALKYKLGGFGKDFFTDYLLSKKKGK
ncbi:unnamed protein product [Moneuplotes crassus]|uniref:EF-hand domain-containing protein n=1 Tax=Euplotes crassus TaxID=5936 RepID=A0AAD1XEZ7_EUPCR|nr:unnamed protein product [Moneuplotes crassus]